ncbi:MAG: DNA cytosine methyltransferase [Verrucomicrobia bacterium]|nr:DNA cytosine methyltransferase [Verrucomicrobiota bacterium]
MPGALRIRGTTADWQSSIRLTGSLRDPRSGTPSETCPSSAPGAGRTSATTTSPAAATTSSRSGKAPGATSATSLRLTAPRNSPTTSPAPTAKRDLGDFARLKEGENSAVAMRERGVKFAFPYEKTKFRDRYTRQCRWQPCSTIVAHLSKDGLMFIHPTQNRSLTPREAARVQSFPDWFRFPAARTHAFRLIGNAVPPRVKALPPRNSKEMLLSS